MFAFENFDIKPDIVTFAKGVTCGYVQLGGVAVSSKIAEYFDDHLLSCGLTYSGHPLACAAGVACFNYYKEANILRTPGRYPFGGMITPLEPVIVSSTIAATLSAPS